MAEKTKIKPKPKTKTVYEGGRKKVVQIGEVTKADKTSKVDKPIT